MSPEQQPNVNWSEAQLRDWMDRHHVGQVRTHVTNLDGISLGKYLNRNKFLKSIPDGHGLSDMALAMDTAGTPHMTFWHEFRNNIFGDIQAKPDLNTLVPDGTDPDLGHVICDFVGVDGKPIAVCPRTLLRRMTDEIAAAGYKVTATYELEFFLFNTSFEDARKSDYKQLEPVGATENLLIYSLRSAGHARPFMQEVVNRMTAQGIEWESWNDEASFGQFEVNLVPCDPVAAADKLVRTRQIIYEVALARQMSVSFMAQIKSGYSSGLHIHHSLTGTDTGEPAFYEADDISPLLQNWIAGILATAPAATSFLCPTVNSFRRMREFTAVPVRPNWAIEDKSAMLRVVTRNPKLARVEHRLAAGDANPYLALAVILAGGLAGIRHGLTPPPITTELGWGRPDDGSERLPDSIVAACDALAADKYLPEVLGEDVVDYWRQSRCSDWLRFHSDGGDPTTKHPTLWEMKNYFEII